MEGITLDDVRRWTRGDWQRPGGDWQRPGLGIESRPAGQLCTDSRSIARGEIFVALRGPDFDGHEFVDMAFQRGAMAAIVERAWMAAGSECREGPLLGVDSPLAALGVVAAENRKRFCLPVVAVVGSSGKTTTKEMIAAVLARRFSVLKTPASENNEIGVPRTLLRLGPQHTAVVVELAARKEGDIGYLCSVARPTIGVLLNIGTAHVGMFKSVEGVAKAKGELLDYIEDESSLALVNADDRVVAKGTKRTKGRLLGFGLTRGSHFSGEGLVLDQEGCGHFSLQNYRIDLQIPGRHNVYNALAAAAVGRVCDVPLADVCTALAEFKPLAMRSEILRKNGICVINDCYNANPGSLSAALELLNQLSTTPSGRKILVLGDMLELGDLSEQMHAEVGRQAVQMGADHFIGLGPMMRFAVDAAVAAGMDQDPVLHVEDRVELVRSVSSLVKAGDVVLVKGSRDMQLEELVKQLT